ncbi:MAG TPA: ATP-binding protein [bacterium]|nr:ATP-binding protein [bacterium]
MEPKKLAEVNETLVTLMRRAFAGGTEVRFDNPGVKTCWMMIDCPRPEGCQLRDKEGVRCWQIMGTFSEEGGCCRLADVLDCRKCEVYLAGIGNDPMTEIGETFNNMMHLIERTQGRLVEMEKLASAGKMAASVAHEINNPLFGISNYIDLISARAGDDPKIDAYTRVIREAINQIRMVTNGLLELARPRSPMKTDSDLAAEIRGAVTLIEPKAVKQNVRISIDCPPGLEKIEARFDKDAMRQVFINIMINALDSMPDGGELNIALEKTDVAAVMTFSDTGAGIDEADLPRVFDLFFSKKARGIGTGVGLYVARRIMDDHEGKITAGGRKGEGAKFRIELPLRAETEDKA